MLLKFVVFIYLSTDYWTFDCLLILLVIQADILVRNQWRDFIGFFHWLELTVFRLKLLCWFSGFHCSHSGSYVFKYGRSRTDTNCELFWKCFQKIVIQQYLCVYQIFITSCLPIKYGRGVWPFSTPIFCKYSSILFNDLSLHRNLAWWAISRWPGF